MPSTKHKSALKAYRDKRHLTQEQAAALVGITQAQWSNIENGQSWASPQTAQRLAKLTGKPISDFLNLGQAETVRA